MVLDKTYFYIGWRLRLILKRLSLISGVYISFDSRSIRSVDINKKDIILVTRISDALILL
jgi:hypothetical protein